MQFEVEFGEETQLWTFTGNEIVLPDGLHFKEMRSTPGDKETNRYFFCLVKPHWQVIHAVEKNGVLSLRVCRKCIHYVVDEEKLGRDMDDYIWELISVLSGQVILDKTTKNMSLNSHNTIRADNLQQRIDECKRYGPHRIILSRVVLECLTFLNLDHFIEAGTLMGAWRNGKMIEHDDDFDMAVYVSNLKPSDTALFLNEINRKAQVWLADWNAKNIASPVPMIACRVVTSYAQKLEFYMPEFGEYPFRDTNYHNVTVDVTLIVPFPGEESEFGQVQHIQSTQVRVPHSCILPVSMIRYENLYYPAPHDPEQYLKSIYGYLGHPARYNPNTGFYEPADV